MDDVEQAVPSEGPSFVRIPINKRTGQPAYAVVDAADAHLVMPFKWHLNGGYAWRTVDGAVGRKESMARRILALRPGDGLETDHISRDKLDNRRSNLRVVTHAQNSQNRERTAKTAGSVRARGVSRAKGKKARPFKAYGYVDGKNVHLGFFDTEAEAAEVARVWRAEHMPYATS